MINTWKKLLLSDIGKIVAGGTPSTKKVLYWNGDVPWITPADLSGYSEKFISGGARYITQQGLKNSSAKLMPAGSVLFSSRAPIGYVAIAKNQVCTNQGFKSIVPNNEIIDSEYLYYYLKSAKTVVEEVASGTTFKEISGTSFAKIIIPVPELRKQKKIVAKLDILFAEIDANTAEINRLKTQLELYKQSVLHAVFDASKLSCETNDLKNLCTIAYGEALPERDRILGTSKVYGSSGEIGSHDKSLNDEPVVVVGRKGNISGVFRVDGPSWVIDTAYAITPNAVLTRDYLYYFLKYNSLQFIAQGQSTAVPSLSREVLYSLKIGVLAIERQKKITKRLDSLFAETNLLIEKIQKTEESFGSLKQSILKQAFEGNLV